MTFPHFLLLLTSGLAGGITATTAGIASLFSYPALLAIGLTPIDSNITNSIALTFLGVGSTIGSKSEWSSHSRLIKKLFLPSLLGGICGFLLLIHTPTSSFKKIVPFLLYTASIIILLPRNKNIEKNGYFNKGLIQISIFAIGVYAGYFGAASGSMIIVTLIQLLGMNVVTAQSVKNVLLAISNGAAAILFILFAHSHISWLADMPLALGFFIGGRVGPVFVRKIPNFLSKVLVAAAGFCVATWLLTH